MPSRSLLRLWEDDEVDAAAPKGDPTEVELVGFDEFVSLFVVEALSPVASIAV